MPQTAELGAGDFKFSGFSGLEPNFNFLTGDGVLLHPHDRQKKAVDDVFGKKVRDHRFSDRNMKLIDGLEIIRAGRVIRIKADRVGRAHQFWIGFSKYPVGARIMNIPGKLLRNNPHLKGLIRGRENIAVLVEKGESETHEKKDLEESYDHFDISRCFKMMEFISSLMPGALAEPDKGHNQVGEPADKENGHKTMKDVDQKIDLIAVNRGVKRKAPTVILRLRRIQTYALSVK